MAIKLMHAWVDVDMFAQLAELHAEKQQIHNAPRIQTGSQYDAGTTSIVSVTGKSIFSPVKFYF